MNAPTLIYTGIILIILFMFGFIGYYFIRNTYKKKNWKMFWYVGLTGLAVLGLFIYTTWF